MSKTFHSQKRNKASLSTFHFRKNSKKELLRRFACQPEFFFQTNQSFEYLKSRTLWNLLATPDAFGSLWVFFMCSTRASPPNTTLWHIGHGVAVAPPIMSAACCCKTPRCSWSSCSTGGGDAGIAVQRLAHIRNKTHKINIQSRGNFEKKICQTVNFDIKQINVKIANWYFLLIILKLIIKCLNNC